MRELVCRVLDRSFVRFMLVGVANTLVGTSIMFGLYNLAGWGYWPASMANYILSSILSFFLNRRFTFRTDERGWRPAARFALNILACYAVAYGVAKPLVRLMFAGAGDAVRDNLSMLTGMCLFTLLNYFGQKFFAFRERA